MREVGHRHAKQGDLPSLHLQMASKPIGCQAVKGTSSWAMLHSAWLQYFDITSWFFQDAVSICNTGW
jgi:hypothetical protein